MPKTVEWNRRAQRYAFRGEGTYGFLSEGKLREVADSGIDVTGARMGKLGSTLAAHAQAYKDGKIDKAAYLGHVETWRDSMAGEVKGVHLSKGLLAVGGPENATQRDYGRIGGLVGPQYRFLENRAIVYADDPDAVLGLGGHPHAADVSASYANAGIYTFERCADISHGESGLPWCVSFLEPAAHHCQAKPGQAEYLSCPGQAALGPVRYDNPKRICAGGRLCKGECRCTSGRYRTKAAAMEAWRATKSLGEEELKAMFGDYGVDAMREVYGQLGVGHV